MKIQINNFGPIKQYTFDLNKDLHLIFGNNNIGKSYSITIVYLVIKSFIMYRDPYYYYVIERNYDFGDLDISAISFDIDSIKKAVLDTLKNWLSMTFLENMYNSFLATYDSAENLQNQFTDEGLFILLESELLTISISVKKGKLVIDRAELKKPLEIRSVQRNRHCKVDKGKVIFYTIENDENSLEKHIRELTAVLFSSFIGEVVGRIESVHFLPASRSGLYQALNAFGQIIAELAKSRSFLKKKIELPNISEPLSDYFLNLSEINLSRRTTVNKALNEIAVQIETEVLKGIVEFDSKTKKIMFTPEHTKLRLDLSSTSSMVSELSPIVSYIRYILAQPARRPRMHVKSQFPPAKPLVIIEEPEAHLHPEIQIKIMEIFSRLIKNNVKMIITSHSNYIFNKANNLILEGKIEIENLQATIFRSYECGSIGESIETNSFGMDDVNFIDVSEALLEEKLNLINAVNDND